VITAAAIADALIELYTRRGRRYRIDRYAINRIVQHRTLSPTLLEEVQRQMARRRYCLVRSEDKQGFWYLVAHESDLLACVPESYALNDRDIDAQLNTFGEKDGVP
jgi:hypothetical protein